MKNLANLALTALAAVLLFGCSNKDKALEEPLFTSQPVYNYPLANPLAATIIGTPPDFKLARTADHKLDEREITIFPARKIPEGFWYYDGLQYGQMLQDRPAPIVYVIAGTGAGYRAAKNIAIGNVLYGLGYHVVLLPSPTHANFIVTASENFFPGNAQADARDLYRAIRMIDADIRKGTQITSENITGYSLGAWNATFIAELDSREKQIGFKKTLLLNPPLSLYTSMQKLDAMLYEGMPNGINGLDEFIDRTLARLSRVNSGSDPLDFSNENLLYETYLRTAPSNARMATMIGLTFRLSAANLVFTSDVMSQSGYIFPKDRPFESTTPLNDYLAVALRTGLGDYFKDVYLPYYTKSLPGMTDQALVADSSLFSIQNWIRQNPDIALITNSNDVILAPGEIAQLQSLFAGKSFVFPTGGHLGNLETPAYAYQVARFFGEQK